MRALWALVLAGCAAKSSLPDVRFHNAAPVAVVDDRRDVPLQPAERVYVRYLYNLDGQFTRRVTRALELERHRRALGVNALDDVPTSTWFTNRIGVRDISPEELAAAPGGISSPEPHKPWTIISTKAGGMTVGFIIEDARGERFLLKFDERGYPEAETAAQIIAAKLMWGFGINVTEDFIVYLRPQDLVLSPKAVVKDQFGNERRLEQADVDRMLGLVEHRRDGSIRALASHWLAGTPLGGHAAEGVRPDDPNDRIPHELRRDLRGLYVLFAWLDHTDVQEGNLLDMWVDDPLHPGRHFVKHYFLDYGTALGVAARKNQEPRYGFEWFVPYGVMLESLFTLGVIRQPWEERRLPWLRGVGMLETDLYDPGAWKSSSPAYRPIYAADRFDKFWAAKIIIRFTRDQIRAVVDAARLSDPRAAEWITDALIVRQRKTARYWFERVNPLDEFVLTDDTLCFKDLSIAHAFEPARTTQYRVTAFTRRGQPLGSAVVAAADGGVTCAKIAYAPDGDGYTIVKVDTTRPHFTGTTFVHVARAPGTNAPRVIGIWRI